MDVIRDQSVARFLDAVAAGEPAPGAGVVAAVTVAAAAGLVAMAARFSTGLGDVPAAMDGVRGRALDLADADARAYGQVLDAARLPADAPDRPERLHSALVAATEVPLTVVGLAREVAEAAARAVADGNAMLRGEALTGSLLAASAARSGSHLVRLNATLGDLGPDPVRRADGWRSEAEASAGRAETSLPGLRASS